MNTYQKLLLQAKVHYKIYAIKDSEGKIIECGLMESRKVAASHIV